MTGPAFSAPPSLNHVAMSMPADALDEASRAAVTAFYGDVFGFEEYPEMTEEQIEYVVGAVAEFHGVEVRVDR